MQAWARRCFEMAAVVTLVVAAFLGSTRSAPSEPELTNVLTPGPPDFSADRPSRLWLETNDRAAVLAAYENEFGEPPPLLAWDGDHDGCESGASTAEYRRAALDRVNFYRAMAGVPAIVTEDPAFTAKAQDAALMMSAEGTLTHHPTGDFGCFSVTGQQAAANSNLHLGRTGPAAIDGYMEDPGPRNTDVGHRNTVLHPPTRVMGVGDVAATAGGHAANALWVFDEHVFHETSEIDRPVMREQLRFVAWPPRGFVPSELVFPRWSFTLADADFSGADIRLYRPGAPEAQREVKLEVVDRVGAEGHVPLPTIVWEPHFLPPTSHDAAYLVVVSGVSYFGDRSTIADDSPVDPSSEADPASPRPTTFAYTVRVLGAEPDNRLTPEEFLASVSLSEPT